ncbi:MAG: ABC transporter ATP-binding protein [Burkholderiales bacterium]|nr:ABC transporter ATP-binding protein [Burkholderiales bacterium]
MPLLEVRELRVAIPVAGGLAQPVRGVSFALERGETLGIVGESGCGKSMTALALMGLLPARARRSAGALALAGRDLAALGERELAREVRGSRMAMIFQEPMTSLNPVYTIGRQLTEAMLLHRKATAAQARARAMELMDRVGIAGAARRLAQYPHELSGGQRQRVMIAMALMNDPEVLIADEPTTALDVTTQAQILRLIAKLQRELGMALMLISHNLAVVSRVADRIAVMYAGEFVETAPAGDLFRDPCHPYTRGLLDSMPRSGAAGPGSRLGSIRGMVRSVVGAMRGCAFAARCGEARDACRALAPPVREAGAGHAYRCVLEPGPARAAPRGAEPAAGAAAVTPRAAAGGPLLAAAGLGVAFRARRGVFGRRYLVHAVNGVSLEIGRGEVLGLVGESGCGKSTLARVLLGLAAPDAGEVRLAGAGLATLARREVARRAQIVFQDPYSSLNPRRTVGEIIRRPLELHGIANGPQRDGRVREMMALTGLPPRLAWSFPGELSGGQRQRVAIARAIIMEPELVICDEPTSALDVSVQSQILNLLLDLRERLGLTYLLITHDLAVVEHMATRVAVMYCGEIVETGSARELFAAPRHPYTRGLLASALTVHPGRGVPDNRIGQGFPNPLAPPPGCRFHPRCPEAMQLCASRPPPAAGGRAAFVRCHLYA